MSLTCLVLLVFQDFDFSTLTRPPCGLLSCSYKANSSLRCHVWSCSIEAMSSSGKECSSNFDHVSCFMRTQAATTASKTQCVLTRIRDGSYQTPSIFRHLFLLHSRYICLNFLFLVCDGSSTGQLVTSLSVGLFCNSPGLAPLLHCSSLPKPHFPVPVGDGMSSSIQLQLVQQSSRIFGYSC